jgi:hypothetical protein
LSWKVDTELPWKVDTELSGKVDTELSWTRAPSRSGGIPQRRRLLNNHDSLYRMGGMYVLAIVIHVAARIIGSR